MNPRIIDSLTGVGLAALLAVVGVGTERIYGDTAPNIAGLEQRVSRLESIVESGGIRVEGGKSELHVSLPMSAEIEAVKERERLRSERIQNHVAKIMGNR